LNRCLASLAAAVTDAEVEAGYCLFGAALYLAFFPFVANGTMTNGDVEVALCMLGASRSRAAVSGMTNAESGASHGAPCASRKSAALEVLVTLAFC
jgi:hypothetical protein